MGAIKGKRKADNLAAASSDGKRLRPQVDSDSSVYSTPPPQVSPHPSDYTSDKEDSGNEFKILRNLGAPYVEVALKYVNRGGRASGRLATSPHPPGPKVDCNLVRSSISFDFGLRTRNCEPARPVAVCV